MFNVECYVLEVTSEKFNTSDECCARCTSLTGCQFWTFGQSNTNPPLQDNDDNCLMYNSSQGRADTPQAYMISGFSTEELATFEYEINTDFFGNDLPDGTRSAQSPGECGTRWTVSARSAS